MAPEAVAIVAMADNGVIGRDNGLPWHLPDDLKRFKALTMGHALLRGRRTFESIGRPLPGRRNLVLTRNPGWQAPGVEPVHSLAEALELAGGATLYVIGGAEVFSLAWPAISRLELTEVHAEPAGDTVLEGFDRRAWREIFREEHEADERHAAPFSFVTLARDRRAD
ncbi:MAG TPA: dihydrofolate reductase [Steroidobacteraceae bacterium]|nr:dihydrofolate reductase [Steroidobacteraceae bacterium]